MISLGCEDGVLRAVNLFPHRFIGTVRIYFYIFFSKLAFLTVGSYKIWKNYIVNIRLIIEFVELCFYECCHSCLSCANILHSLYRSWIVPSMDDWVKDGPDWIRFFTVSRQGFDNIVLELPKECTFILFLKFTILISSIPPSLRLGGFSIPIF